MNQLIVRKNFHIHLRDKYTLKDSSNKTQLTALGTILNHKKSYTIQDLQENTLAEIHTI